VLKIFPYLSFRRGQDLIYNIVSRFLDSSENELWVEAPTGVGKTAAVLSPLLEHGLRVLWVTRTLKEQEVVLKEVNRINRVHGTGFKVTLLRGISERCPYTRPPFPHQTCLTCKSIKCPYREQFLEAFHSNVVVATYSMLRDSRDKVASLPVDVTVFDEAHTLHLPPVKRIPREWILRAAMEAGARPDPNILLKYAGVAERIVLEKGFSYLYEVVRVLSSGEWFLDGSDVVVVDWGFRDWVKRTFMRKIYLTATAPPNVGGLKVSVPFNSKFIIYTGVKLPLKLRLRFLDEVARLIRLLGLFYKSVIFLPSTTYRDILYSKFDWEPLNVTVVLEEFEEVEKGVLLAVSGGKYSEGIDITAEAVAVIGVPYAKPDEYLRRIYRRYRFKGKRKLFYEYPAVVRAVQAIGRVLRNPNERKLVVLADKRFLKLRKLLPLWLKKQEILVIEDYRKLEKEIILFNTRLNQ